MRRWGAILLVSIGCLDAPPSSNAGLGPPCQSLSAWGESAQLPDVEGVGPTVDASGSLLLWETLGPDQDIGAAEIDGDAVVAAPDSLVAALNTEDAERNPSLSLDGRTVWFDRGPVGGAALFVSRRERASDDFPDARPVSGLGMPIEGPELWDDGNELYFSVSNGTDQDLARASCAGEETCTFGGVLAGLASSSDDVYPAIRSDGLELIYFSGNALFTTSRDNREEAFTGITPLEFFGHDPDLSADGLTLYFARDGAMHIASRECLD